MTESGSLVRSFVASDGYPLHVRIWPAEAEPHGRVVVLHGVQSHGGWYHGLGRSLAAAGYTVSFPDRRGSGANALDRGHTRTARRLNLDLAEWLRAVRGGRDAVLVSAEFGVRDWGRGSRNQRGCVFPAIGISENEKS